MNRFIKEAVAVVRMAVVVMLAALVGVTLLAVLVVVGGVHHGYGRQSNQLCT